VTPLLPRRYHVQVFVGRRLFIFAWAWIFKAFQFAALHGRGCVRAPNGDLSCSIPHFDVRDMRFVTALTRF
jgi:hypothetical protein